jgi:hypothetical protein
MKKYDQEFQWAMLVRIGTALGVKEHIKINKGGKAHGSARAFRKIMLRGFRQVGRGRYVLRSKFQ